ncbi:MAG: VOC family protein [Rhodospirillaceae bacterium]
MVQPIPDGYTAVTPYIIVDGAAEAIDFYANAFDAEEFMRLPNPETGKLLHAEITINGAHIMLGDTNPEMGAMDPRALGGIAASITLYLPDMDAPFAQAVKAGAEVKSPPMDMF